MSNKIQVSNQILEEANDISNLAIGEDLVLDLSRIVPKFDGFATLGYYFADEREKIIAGKTIATSFVRQELTNLWVTIAANDVPTQAMTLYFFID